MNKGIVIFFIIVIVGLGFAYYYFENPFKADDGMFNVSVYAVDENNNQIKTGYKLYVDNSLFVERNTSSQYIIREKVPFDKEIRIETFNIKNQSYYKEEVNFFSEKLNENKRVKIELTKPGKLNITDFGLLRSNNKNYINISTEGLLRDVVVCVDWSFHFYYVDLINLTSTDKIKEYDECYLIDEKMEKGKEYKINYDYKIFEKPTSSDYIKFLFFDSRNLEKPIKTHKNFY